jgi:PAS domain S-box-containing protein
VAPRTSAGGRLVNQDSRFGGSGRSRTGPAPTTVPATTLNQELRLLPRQTPDVHLRHDLDGRWLAASPSVEPVLGYAPEDLIGRPALELVHPSDRRDVDRALRAALAITDTLSLRLRLVRRNGTLLRADVRFEAVRDEHGAVCAQRVTVRDAADRLGADQLRAQWEVLFLLTRRGIAVSDPHTKTLASVNPAYAAMHGGTADDFVGLPLARVLSPMSAERLAALADQIDESGFLSYESEHVRLDGSVFPAAVETMAARDHHGEQLYWLTWIEDLTERRRAERDAARHADEMARSNADLDRFAGVVSHDLQSPMRVIAGCARILERRAGEQLTPEQRELVEHIVGGVHRMTALLDGIREWSQVRGESAPMSAVDCGAVVDGVLSSLAADLDAAGASVRVGTLPVLTAHPAALAQLFQNLIANAVKFRGDAPPEIEIAAHPAGGTWEFTVADNGIGIEPEHAERVFEFGRRLHNDEKFPGTGIGLTVCKTVVERHGGRIWVEPSPGGGSRFHFTLPAAQPSR